MLINAERQPADQDAGDLCDPTQYAPRDRRPYWNEDIASFSAAVWLPTGTADRGAAINRPHGWSSKTAAHSWFSTSRIAAPNPDLPRLYSPAAVQSTTIYSNQGATRQQSRRIQVYPDRAQKVTITTWLTASRWTYNLTVEILQSGIPAVWKHIASIVMPEVKALHPEWDSVPYQVKRTAVRDACRAMSNVKTFNLELKASQTHGNRADEEFAELGYRSRHNPKQSCYIPDDAVTEHGVYHTILGPLRMAEAIPAEHKECRLVQERGLYWLTVPYPAQCDIETPSGDGVVALDPGVRTFLTYFSETECGKLGHHAFCYDAALQGRDFTNIESLPNQVLEIQPTNGRSKQKANVDHHGTPVGRPFRNQQRLPKHLRQYDPAAGHSDRHQRYSHLNIGTGDTIVLNHKAGQSIGRAVIKARGTRVAVGKQSASIANGRIIARNPRHRIRWTTPSQQGHHDPDAVTLSAVAAA